MIGGDMNLLFWKGEKYSWKGENILPIFWGDHVFSAVLLACFLDVLGL